jgi:hypothetical protein
VEGWNIGMMEHPNDQILEEWNVGMMEDWEKETKKRIETTSDFFTHYSIIPAFQSSDRSVMRSDIHP